MTFQTNFPLEPMKLPYVTVSTKGISNGLSDIPNDGFDFGPDTMLNTTSKGQYGPPYTQTSGIQEAFNYLQQFNGGEIKFASGIYYVNETATFTSQGAVKISGIRPNFVRGAPLFENGTIIVAGQNLSSSAPMFQFLNTSNGNNDGFVTLEDMGFIGSYTPIGGIIPSLNTYPSNSAIQLGNTTANEGGGPVAMYLNNLKIDVAGIGILIYSGGGPIFLDNLHMDGNGAGIVSNASFQAGKLAFFGNNYSNISLYNASSSMYSPTTIQIDNLFMDGVNSSPNSMITLFSDNNGYTNLLQIGKLAIGTGGGQPILSQNGSSNWNVDIVSLYDYGFTFLTSYTSSAGTLNIHIGSAYFENSASLLANNQPLGINSSLDIDQLYPISVSSTFYTTSITNLAVNFHNIFPTPETTASGTTAGTVALKNTVYNSYYKKYVITFNGYENDTTTNQTINYPLPFSTNAVITANNTGLTISTTTSGITITSPNSTTTYNGIVIIEGY